MNYPAGIYLDFVGRTRPAHGGGLLLCAAGIVNVAILGLAFSGLLAQRTELEGRLEALAPPAVSTPGPAAVAAQAAVLKMNRALSIPWTDLLKDLEAASSDLPSQVSLLQVEPNADKRTLQITAEVRSLPDALLYLQRLQRSTLLRYPMLESHERVKDNPEHPVRIKLAAEWRV